MNYEYNIIIVKNKMVEVFNLVIDDDLWLMARIAFLYLLQSSVMMSCQREIHHLFWALLVSALSEICVSTDLWAHNPNFVKNHILLI